MTWRRDLGDSVRLAGAERWVATDLLLGVAAYVVWVAGTGALVREIAGVAGVGFSPSATSPAIIAIASVLWLVLPAAAVVYRLRDRLRNIRGNVEQAYRLDHPVALLVPPAVLLAAFAGVAVGVTARWYVFAALLPAALYLLVRATAYSYRVFSFAYPSVLYAATFVSAAVQALAFLYAAAPLIDEGGLIERAAATLGVSWYVTDTVAARGASAPLPLVAAVAVPVALVLAYLAVQTLAALVVRLTSPEVTRSDVRTGQRYPSFVTVVDDAGPAATGSTASSGTSGGSAGGSGSAKAGGAEATTDEGRDTDDAGDEDAGDLDDVGHTRVFTPDEDADGPGFDDDALARDGSGEAAADDTGGRCSSCGETAAAAAATVCPNCGSPL